MACPANVRTLSDSDCSNRDWRARVRSEQNCLLVPHWFEPEPGRLTRMISEPDSHFSVRRHSARTDISADGLGHASKLTSKLTYLPK
jgi:hypothetical protein